MKMADVNLSRRRALSLLIIPKTALFDITNQGKSPVAPDGPPSGCRSSDGGCIGSSAFRKLICYLCSVSSVTDMPRAHEKRTRPGWHPATFVIVCWPICKVIRPFFCSSKLRVGVLSCPFVHTSFSVFQDITHDTTNT